MTDLHHYRNALHFAAENADFESVRLLLDWPSFPDAELDMHGNSALHYAASALDTTPECMRLVTL